MLNKSRSRTRKPLWIIASYQNNQLDVLTTDLYGDGGFLPIFSFEEEAETFLRLWEDDEQEEVGWRSRKTTAGELISVLSGPCVDARGVALDPLPLDSTMLAFLSVDRKPFVQDLIGEQRKGLAEELVPTRGAAVASKHSPERKGFLGR
jgi:hypothetical protein